MSLVEKQAIYRDENVPKQSSIDKILDTYAGEKGTLIPILQDTQSLFNYLPKPALLYIADKTDIPISTIYGVVTFYSQFHLQPRGRNIICVCQGTACHVRGGKVILKAVEKELGIKAGHTTEDLRFTLETIACLGACGLAPVMKVNDDTHGRMTKEEIIKVLAQYE
ncbi:MAG: NADH-quinone oxidoreductase subunit NuoE [Megasphaera sp.]|jgi:NADH-quinone oxidoreductase subunit E|uniref:NADH-quinone oxidoreductase subunit NuoE n=1 Tax=Megasphaera sueciensis TaxID=349094 RepID=UPI002ACB0D19|nr:NADH-quinone oxidoreductase subunit NuoE [Megasphaera sp.]MCI1822949.1 NADH-quinone oxidoreductase subunit NuoE [Megasphaera sp.]